MKKYTFTVQRDNTEATFNIYAKSIQSAIALLKNVEDIDEKEIANIQIN